MKKTNKSMLLILALLIAVVLSLSAVSAEDVAADGDIISVDDSISDVSLDDASIGETANEIGSVEASSEETLDAASVSTNANDDDNALGDGEGSSWYVDSNVETSGDGSQASPFKTIGEAVNAGAGTGTIYLASGIYNGTDDRNFTFDGGELSIIGSGRENTIVDMLSDGRFAFVNANSTLFLSNLKFTNADVRNDFGAVLYDEGILNIENCDFENGYCANWGGALFIKGNTTIRNCNFINNSASQGGAICIYCSNGASNHLIENCTFDNNNIYTSSGNGGTIYIEGNYNDKQNLTIKDSTFTGTYKTVRLNKYIDTLIDNCTFFNNTCPSSYQLQYGEGVVIYSTGNCNITVNSCDFENNTKDEGYIIYALADELRVSNSKFLNNIPNMVNYTIWSGSTFYLENNTCDSIITKLTSSFKSGLTVTVLDNATHNINSFVVPLYATLTDDNGNVITGGSQVSLLLNDRTIKSDLNFNGGQSSYYLKEALNGTYLVQFLLPSTYTNVTYKTGVVNVVPNLDTVDIYVATTGSDETGDGSQANPYKTVEKGLDVANTVYSANIHIKGGTYDYSSFKNIDTAGGVLNIMGYDGDVVIDMGNKYAFCDVSNRSNVLISNITFMNGNYSNNWSLMSIILSYGNLTVKNCNFMNNTGYYATLMGANLVDSCTFYNNTQPGGSSYGSDINTCRNIINSTFYGTQLSSYPSVAIGYNINNITSVYIEGCKFYTNSFIRQTSNRASLTFESCEFNNPEVSSIIVQYKNLTVNNCTFSNSSQANIQLSGSSTIASITNSKFINNTGITGQSSVYDSNIKELYLENNIALDNAAPYVYAALTSNNRLITSPTTIVVFNNETVEVEGRPILKAKIFDDNGNSIALSKFSFNFDNGTFSGKLTNDEYIAQPTGIYNGTYLVSATSEYLKNLTVKTGVLIITPVLNRELYVSTSGSDEIGDGTESNPYASIQKAMEKAIAINNYIHIADGVYNVEAAFTIDTNNGNLSIVGSGKDTILDMGNSTSFISSISSNSIVELKNLTLANAINRFITSAGTLTLDNINLINATGSTGGAIRNTGKLTVMDSYFENIVASSNGGAIWSNRNLYLLNNIFNKTSSANRGGAIFSSSYLYLENNTFIDTIGLNGNNIFASNTIEGGLILTVMDNETWDISSNPVTFNASLTDENNNPIYVSGMQLSFFIDGVNVASTSMTGEVGTASADLKVNGVHVLSATLGNIQDMDVKTAVLNISNPDVMHDVYISAEGSDETGDGTSANPYATFTKALTVVESMNGVIHVMSNFTEGFGSINNLINLTIIGEGDDICKLGNTVLGTINNGSSLNLVNLNFTGFPNVFNSFLTSQAGSKLSLINCTFENNQPQGGNQASFIHSLGDELNIINCKIINNNLKPYSIYMDSQFIYSYGKTNIINSTFANNRYTSVSSLRRTLLSVNNATIENCVFEDNLGLLMSASNTTINNCTFERNDDGNYGLIRGSVIINNSQFKDMNCPYLISVTVPSSITNNTFEDINGTNIIYVTGSDVVTIFNNTLSNIGDTKYVYLASATSQVNGSSYTLTFNDNATYEIVGNSLALNASLVDADGNYITGPGAIIYFTLNGEDIGSQACMDIANYNAKFSGEGEYILSGYTNSVYDPESLTIKTATLKITQIPEKIIYVDILGNDETGDGSEDNPYASLSRAMQDVVALNNIIYIQPGVYDNMVISDQFVFIENQTLSIIGLSNEVDKVIIENISSTFLNAMGIDTSKTYGSLIVKNIEFVNATPRNLFFRLNYLNTVELENVSLIDSSISGNYFIGDYYSDGKLIISGLKVSNLTTSVLAYSNGNATVEIVDSVFESNTFTNNLAYAYNSVNCSISNSVFVSNKWNTMVYSNGVVELENNWWGNNTNADELRTYTGREITNWIVAEVTANDSDIKIGDSVKFDIVLKLNDGSELADILPTRIVKAIAENTVFDADEVEIADNKATITGTVNGVGDITISIDDQDFVFEVTRDNAYITVDNVAIKLGETATVTVTFTDDNGPLANKELAVKVNGEESTVTTDADGKATITLADLAKGNHIVEVNFAGDNMHDPVTGAGLVMVSDAVLTVNIPEVNYGESPTINAELKDTEGNPLSGLVTVSINGKDYNVLVKDGEGSLAVPDKFDAGEYTVTAKLIGDSITESTSTFTVNPIASLMTVTVDNIAHGEPFTINLDIADKTISGLSIVTINGVDYAIEIVNGVASKTINALLPSGPYDVTAKFIGDNYDIADATTTFNVSEIIGSNVVVTVKDIQYGETETVKVTVTDEEGNPLSGILKVILDAEEQNITITGGEAEIVFENLLTGSHSVIANYIGDNQYASSSGFASFKVGRKATQIVYSDMNTTAIDSSIEPGTGKYFEITLRDSDGVPLANKPVQFGFNGKIYNKTTDENGIAKLQINLQRSDIYTFAVSFQGDDQYNGSFAVAKITVKKQTPTLTVPNKSYKASAKTKTLTATFKSASGKVVAGKKVTFTVNGKTYTATTNDKGVASVNVSLSTKKTYSFTAKFAGDNTYAAISKNAKLVIK